MPHAYMVRITHSYQDASGVVALWASRSEKLVVYEHVGSLTEKVHIHLVMICDTHKKQLRNIGMATGLDLKGNKNCSFKEYDGSETPYVYMTKGEHDPKFIKGYEEDLPDKWKRKWQPKINHSTDYVIYSCTFDDGQEDDDDFERYVNDLDVRSRDIYNRYNWAKLIAKKSAFQYQKLIWNQRTTQIYKMLVFTYCFRHNVIIDPKDRTFAGF